jgi:hypothetical protein
MMAVVKIAYENLRSTVYDEFQWVSTLGDKLRWLGVMRALCSCKTVSSDRITMLSKMAWLTVNRHSIQLDQPWRVMGVAHAGLRSQNRMVHFPVLILTYLTLDCLVAYFVVYIIQARSPFK